MNGNIFPIQDLIYLEQGVKELETDMVFLNEEFDEMIEVMSVTGSYEEREQIEKWLQKMKNIENDIKAYKKMLSKKKQELAN